MTHLARVDTDRLGPAKVDQQDGDRANRIQMVAGVERQAPIDPRCLIPTSHCHLRMSPLVEHQAEQQPWDQEHRVDDELTRIVEQHQELSVGKKRKGPRSAKPSTNE